MSTGRSARSPKLRRGSRRALGSTRPWGSAPTAGQSRGQREPDRVRQSLTGHPGQDPLWGQPTAWVRISTFLPARRPLRADGDSASTSLLTVMWDGRSGGRGVGGPGVARAQQHRQGFPGALGAVADERVQRVKTSQENAAAVCSLLQLTQVRPKVSTRWRLPHPGSSGWALARRRRSRSQATLFAGVARHAGPFMSSATAVCLGSRSRST